MYFFQPGSRVILVCVGVIKMRWGFPSKMSFVRVEHRDARVMAMLTAMFCLGVYTLLAQMVITREMMTAFLGNELIIGVVLTAWLLLIGLGAWAGRASVRIDRGGLACGIACLLLVMLAGLAPLQVLVLRVVREWMQIAPGEYAPAGKVAITAALVLLPSCAVTGFLFPLTCHLLSLHGEAKPVSRVYMAEAAGSTAGALLFTFVLAEHLQALQVAALASAWALSGAALAGVRTPLRRGLAILACLAGFAALNPGCLARLEARSIQARWRAFGVLTGHAAPAGGTPVRLAASLDTRYQNLALTESAGQFTLYGDGHVLFAFPDEPGYEHRIDFIMAQKPAARRILLLGGNPVGDLPQLLRYRAERIVFVDLDPGVEKIVRGAAARLYAAATKDPRVGIVHEDGPLFVKRCRERFDAILVLAPEPSTAGLNRFYTREFYADLRGLLTPGGFVYSAIEASELLENDAVPVAACVYKTLQSTFEIVKVTAGPPLQFFASGPGGTLTFERQALFERSRSAGVAARYFRPQYFLAADELAPEKIALTEQRLSAASVPINSVIRPIACFYNLVLWSRYSASQMEFVLRRVGRLRTGAVCAWIVIAFLACLLTGLVRRRKNPLLAGRNLLWLAAGAMTATGFWGIAMEITLLYAFQSLYGFVYSRMGLIVGLFMLGSLVGAWAAGRRPDQAEQRRSVASLMRLSMAMLLTALLLPVSLAWVAGSAAAWSAHGTEWIVHANAALAGVLVAAQFAGASRLIQCGGLPVGTAAALTNAADYLGSALGGLLAGMLLLPILGIQATCLIMAALLGSTFLCLFAAWMR